MCERAGHWMCPGKIESPRESPSAESEIGPSKSARHKARNKMPDTFYLVRANSTIGALTLRFPPQTGAETAEEGTGGKARAPKGWRLASPSTPPWIGRGFSSLGNPLRIPNCIPKHLHPPLLAPSIARAKALLSSPRKIFTSRSLVCRSE